MTTFQITPEARADARELLQGVARYSSRSAESLLDHLFDAIACLAECPDSGHRCEGVVDEPLDIALVRDVAVVYRPDTAPLQVLRLFSRGEEVFDALTG